jgi:hypothetical protein
MRTPAWHTKLTKNGPKRVSAYCSETIHFQPKIRKEQNASTQKLEARASQQESLVPFKPGTFKLGDSVNCGFLRTS